MTRRFGSVGLLAALLSVSVGISGQNRAGTSTLPSLANGDWPHYTADIRGTKYSPLDQINAANFKTARSRVALQDRHPRARGPSTSWKARRWRSTACSTRPAARGARSSRSMARPASCCGRTACAKASAPASRRASCPDAACPIGPTAAATIAILYVTTGYRLVALNANNGAPIAGFGKDGIVDLKEGVVFGAGQQIDLETGEIGWHATPAIAKDVVIVGSSFREGATVSTHNNTKGLVRGVRRAHRQAALDVPHDSRFRVSSATTRGRRTRGR